MFVAPEDVDETSVVSRARRIGELDVDGLSVLVDQGAGRGHALSGTATLVWRCLDGSAPLSDVIDDLADVFAESREQVAPGVVSLVQNLGALGLLDGVVQSVQTLPIDVQFVDDDCDDPKAGTAPDEGAYDPRYLLAPPNV